MTYLALDQGGHGSRALVFDAGGQLLATATVPIRTLRSDDGRVEHDPEELVQSLRQAVALACAALPPGLCPRAAGLATQRSSMACWRRSTGEPLSPVISWQDRRNATWLRGLEEHGTFIRARTGLVPSPHYGASKMRWCLDHLPAVQAAARAGDLAMGPLASFLLHRLLEERPLVADPANGARTQLWDLATRDWSPELARLFGLDTALLPRAVASHHAFGTLPTPRGPVPLTVCTGDQSAAPYAFGPLDPATAYVNTGTGAFVQRVLKGPVPEAPELLVSVVWSDRNRVDYLLEGTVNGAGSALDWLAAEEGVPVADLLGGLADAGGPELQPPLFLNGISGLGSPYWVPEFRSRFLGEGSRAGRVAAVLESVAFLLQVNLEALAPHGPPWQRVLLTGGFLENAWFCRALGALAGVPLARARDPEATARGLAFLVASQDGGREPFPTPPLALTPAEPWPALRTRYAAWREAMAAALGRRPG